MHTNRFKKIAIIAGGFALALLPTVIFAQSLVNCGKTADVAQACKFSDLIPLLKAAYLLFAQVATVLGFGTFVFYLIKLGWSQDKAAAKAELKNKLLWIISILTAIWVMPALFLALLKAVGTDERFIRPIEGIALVETTYAQNQNQVVPSPVDLGGGIAPFFFKLYDIFLRWFAFPAMIALWVYSAALLIFAQGMPEKLKQARGWLWFTFIITVILLFTRVFLEAVINSVKSIT